MQQEYTLALNIIIKDDRKSANLKSTNKMEDFVTSQILCF